MRRVALVAVAVLCLAGCGGRKSSLLLERHARGPLSDEGSIAMAVAWKLEPVMQTQAKGDVEVTVNHASAEYLKNFFANKAAFGPYAGRNPYYAEHLVFYVQVANRSGKRILVDPAGFILVDDRGNQYATIGIDYVTAFGEYRRPVGSTTRSVLEGASPGYFGLSVPVGKLFVRKPQGQFALLKQSSLQPGYLYPNVVHDGLIAFWNPALESTKLRLVLANLKSDFDANDWPKSSLDFTFEFQANKH